MNKPKWRFYFMRKNFQWKLSYYFNKYAFHKVKHDSVRVELIPKLEISWLWWEVHFVQGSAREWEWYWHVTELNNGDVEAAKQNYPWGKENENGEFVQSKIWLE